MTRARVSALRHRLSVRLVILAAVGVATGGALGIIAGLLGAPAAKEADHVAWYSPGVDGVR